MPYQWKYAIIMVLHKKKDRAECGNCRGISLVAHAGKILPRIIIRCLSEYCERVGILSKGQSGFQPNHSTVDIMFTIHRLQELARKNQTPMYACFFDLTKAYDSADRTLLWTVLARFGVPQTMISVIRQFHDGMRACVRLDNRVCSGWLAVEYGLCQGCSLAPLLFNIFFAAVINVAYTRSNTDKGIMDALVHLRKKKGAWGRGEATAGDPFLATLLWGMIYADDAGVVSQSPEQLRKMMGAIVVVCATFGLIISEAKTEIMCLRTKGMSESTVTFSVETAGQVYNQANEFIYLGGTSTTMLTCPSRSIGAYATHGAASGSIPLNCTTDRALHWAQNPDAQSRGTRNNAV